jgi:hypothetical protein
MHMPKVTLQPHEKRAPQTTEKGGITMADNKNTIPALLPEYRPCWVYGRKALLHRWVDSARPVKPRGVEDEENTARYQLHSVHGLVEFQDGAMARAWPQDIQFADIREEFLNDWPPLPYTVGEDDQTQEEAGA